VVYKLTIKSPVTSDKVRQMVEMMEKGYYTGNSIKNPVPVSGRQVHNC
jgi:hypothetical protein